MKRTKLEQEIYNIINTEFCIFLNLSNQKVTDAMNAAPCPLGSEKHFEKTAKQIAKLIKRDKK